MPRDEGTGCPSISLSVYLPVYAGTPRPQQASTPLRTGVETLQSSSGNKLVRNSIFSCLVTRGQALKEVPCGSTRQRLGRAGLQ